ncbi:translation initiation factor 1 (eIF-1/SUI1) [Magnetococcus marinus MC-1]|uniref:Translation initiation factor 1 (eIF-1/SUI1) n=1 Tax=Magnetococcus marinus (strain ATCC BAA-1437 / JCM 17883 / MC-1) TaxID=156889 RepID=A0L9Q3_MAGMM|nr:translation initiation factor Sui1 [Magnetococcus marinus]ABK44696.1 translation initiation factor 1 (eIF-1/SUI1) [Magnetococcus marinus MC-1]
MSSKYRAEDRVVYSTEQGRLCPQCHQTVAACCCRQARSPVTSDGVVRVSRETKGRKGRGVTLIKGLPLSAEALMTQAKHLKTLCGSGGTVKDGVVEIQGDHVEQIMDLLKKQNYTVKRAGG